MVLTINIHKKFGCDYLETFSPVTSFSLFTNQWYIQQIDVNNAFLNGIVQEESTWICPLALRTQIPV